MPPVACGNGSDPRRWVFQTDGPVDPVVGTLHWPSNSIGASGSSGSSSSGSGTPLASSVGAGRLESSDAYTACATSGGVGDGRFPVDDSQRLPPGFRGAGDYEGTVAEGMDPRIGSDSNGTLVGSAGGGAPSSRQGSPFTSPFDPPLQQFQQGGGGGGAVVDITPGMGVPYGATTPSHSTRMMPPSGQAGHPSLQQQQQQHAMASSRSGAPPPVPSRHNRAIFDEPVGMPPLDQHSSGGLTPSSLGSDNINQVSDGMGGGVAIGSGLGTGAASPASMSAMPLGPGARIRMTQGNVPQPQQHGHQGQQQQRHQIRATGGGGGGGAVNVEMGLGSRVGAAGWASGSGPDDPMSMALASIPHGASSLPASAVPTVLERFPGFVRCVMDIAPEVVGWVIGRSGAHIKEMKHRSGCGMWVDQKDLKLYITGADMPRIHAAARLVGDLISKAPVNVNSAGVEDEVTSHMIECPPHLIGLLIGRGGSTIKRIKVSYHAVHRKWSLVKPQTEESRANVVINQKMMKVIVSGIPQSVRLGVAMIEDVITFGRSAEHAGGLGPPPNFLDFPGSVAFGGMSGIGGVSSIAEFEDLAPDRFSVRATGPAMSGGGRLAPLPPPSFASGPGNLAGGAGAGAGPGNLFAGQYSASASYDTTGGMQHQQQLQHEQHRRPSDIMVHGQAQDQLQGQGLHAQPVATAAVGGGSGGGGGGGQPAEMGYDAKDMDWSVFSASSFNIGPEGQHEQHPHHQQQSHQHHQQHEQQQHRRQQQQHWSSSPSQQMSPLSQQHQHSGGGGGGAASSSAGGGENIGMSRSGVMGVGGVGGGGGGGGGSGTGSISSGGTPPQAGQPTVPPMIGNRVVGSPGAPVPGMIPSLSKMARLSITSDDSSSAGQSLGQTNRHRERAGSPVGQPADLTQFLSDMGLGEYAAVLVDNEIDLEAVQLMADSDFQDIGIPKGPRVKLLYALRTNRHPPRSGDIATMKAFLTSLGLDRYCKAFEEGQVDMGAVDVMEESDYAQLGVAKGPRLKMMNVLAKAAGGGAAGGGMTGCGTANSVTGGNPGSVSGSVSACSPDTRHSPPFRSHCFSSTTTFSTSAVASVSAAAAAAAAAAPRPPNTPPRHGPSSIQDCSSERSSERSASAGVGVGVGVGGGSVSPRPDPIGPSTVISRGMVAVATSGDDADDHGVGVMSAAGATAREVGGDDAHVLSPRRGIASGVGFGVGGIGLEVVTVTSRSSSQQAAAAAGGVTGAGFVEDNEGLVGKGGSSLELPQGWSTAPPGATVERVMSPPPV